MGSTTSRTFALKGANSWRDSQHQLGNMLEIVVSYPITTMQFVRNQGLMLQPLLPQTVWWLLCMKPQSQACFPPDVENYALSWPPSKQRS